MAGNANQSDLITALGKELEKMNAAASADTGACVIQTYSQPSEMCLHTTADQCAQLKGTFLGVGKPCPF